MKARWVLAEASSARPSVHVALHHRGRHEESAEDEARSAEPFQQADGVLAAAEVSAVRERGLVGNEPVEMDKILVGVRGGSLDMDAVTVRLGRAGGVSGHVGDVNFNWHAMNEWIEIRTKIENRNSKRP